MGNNGSNISGFYNHFATQIAAINLIIAQIENFLNNP
jgi:hypothetical protein